MTSPAPLPRSPAAELKRHLLAFETSLLSDQHRSLKLALAWVAQVAFVVACGLLALQEDIPGTLEYVEDARAYEGAPVLQSYTSLIRLPEGGPPLLRTNLGFHPLHGSVPPVSQGAVVSLRGTWRVDGAVEVQEVWLHPLRRCKEQVSLWTSAGLALALLLRYGRSAARLLSLPPQA